MNDRFRKTEHAGGESGDVVGVAAFGVTEQKRKEYQIQKHPLCNKWGWKSFCSDWRNVI